MANVLYPKGKEAFIGKVVGWDTDVIKAVLVDTAQYTYSAAHSVLNDIAAGARVATSAGLSTKTITNGQAGSANVTFSAVTGATVEAVVLYQDTGNATTSRLIAYIDTGTNIPATPNGGDITVAPSGGIWFSL